VFVDRNLGNDRGEGQREPNPVEEEAMGIIWTVLAIIGLIVVLQYVF
jgi:hypothetical protein